MIRLAKQYGRYGYRKVALLMRVEGWSVNHKKIERLWRDKGLQLPRRHKKRRWLYHKDSSIGCARKIPITSGALISSMKSLAAGAHTRC